MAYCTVRRFYRTEKKMTATSTSTPPLVHVILCRATLETTRIWSKHAPKATDKEARYQLLNCDDHTHLLRKHQLDPAHYRPDITHQCLLTLLDSPLNKSGRLRVYIQTEKHVLIQVNPQVRIPRTFKRFSGLMVQLLHKLSIRSAEGGAKLLRVIKNPLTDHLPVPTFRVVLSQDAPVVRATKWVKSLPKDMNIVISVGSFAHGKDDFGEEWGVDERVSLSEYPLSASVACGKICNAFEDLWNIL